MIATSAAPSKVRSEEIPAELRDRPQWVAWHLRYMANRTKPSKVPISPATGREASVTSPGSWSRFDDALASATGRGLDGVGYVFAESDPFAGIDLDACRCPTTGKIDSWAAETIADLATYAEVSPSQTGVKLILEGTLPGPRHRIRQFELYDRRRFFTVTGWRLPNASPSPMPRQRELDELYTSLFGSIDKKSAAAPAPAKRDLIATDAELVERAMRAKNGAKFSRLWSGDWSGYNSPSEADLALCRRLAFWAGNDAERIAALFGQSGLARAKWFHRADYRERTLRTVLADNVSTNGYDAQGTLSIAQVGSSSLEDDSEEKKLDTRNRIDTRETAWCRVLSECYRLSRLQRGGSFHLSARDAAKAAGCSRMVAWRALCRFQAVGTLTLHKAGVRGAASKVAAEFILTTGVHHANAAQKIRRQNRVPCVRP